MLPLPSLCPNLRVSASACVSLPNSRSEKAPGLCRVSEPMTPLQEALERHGIDRMPGVRQDANGGHEKDPYRCGLTKREGDGFFIPTSHHRTEPQAMLALLSAFRAHEPYQRADAFPLKHGVRALTLAEMDELVEIATGGAADGRSASSFPAAAKEVEDKWPGFQAFLYGDPQPFPFFESAPFPTPGLCKVVRKNLNQGWTEVLSPPCHLAATPHPTPHPTTPHPTPHPKPHPTPPHPTLHPMIVCCPWYAGASVHLEGSPGQPVRRSPQGSKPGGREDPPVEAARGHGHGHRRFNPRPTRHPGRWHDEL